MLSREQAREVAANRIRQRLFQRYGDNIVILDEHTIEKAYGWIFFYQHRRFVETRKIRDGLIGNGPLLVDKETGKVVVFGSFGPIEYWCSLYETGRTREDKDGVVHLLFREDLKRRRQEGTS